jgi:hypothetical protein
MNPHWTFQSGGLLMLHLRDFVIPLLAAIIVGILVWAYLDSRLQNTLLESNAIFPDHYTLSTLTQDRSQPRALDHRLSRLRCAARRWRARRLGERKSFLMNSPLPLPAALPAASTSSAWHAEQPVCERDLTFSWRAVSRLYQHFPASISPFVPRTVTPLLPGICA